MTEVLSKSLGNNIVHYQPAVSVHGASIFVTARDPKSYVADLKRSEIYCVGWGNCCANLGVQR